MDANTGWKGNTTDKGCTKTRHGGIDVVYYSGSAIPSHVVSQSKRAKVLWSSLRDGTNIAIKKKTVSLDLHNREPAKACLREIKLLQWFRGHQNIVRLREVVYVEEPDVFMVFLFEDYMMKSLSEVIANNPPPGYRAIQTYIRQTLCGLQFIHSADVIHRDIRPRNLLIGADGILRITSFGLAVGMQDISSFRLTDPTDDMQWYSAPEILTGVGDYGTKIDIWGVGCTLGELIHGHPIFDGQHPEDPLYTLRTYLGPIKRSDLDRMLPKPKRIMSRPPLGDERGHSDPFLVLFNKGSRCHSWPRKEKDTVTSILTELLYLNPYGRSTSAKALKHAYFKIGLQIDPYCCELFDFGFEERENYSFEEIKRCIIAAVTSERPFGAEPLNTMAYKSRAMVNESALSVLEQNSTINRVHHQFSRESGDRWKINDGQVEVSDAMELEDRGSYAVVRKGTYKDSNGVQAVAIKILNVGDDGLRINVKLYRELAVWTMLNHPHIAKIIGYIGEQFALVSRWYENGSLEDFLSANHSTADGDGLSFDVLQGLHYLHTFATPVIHGDIKSHNIFINGKNRAVLGDFGMSMVLDNNPTGFTSTRVEGDTRYLPRELLDNQPRTMEGDIWAYGCICLRIHYRRQPYDSSRNDNEIRERIKRMELPHIFDPRNPHRRWDEVMHECWALNPFSRATTKDLMDMMQIKPY